MEGTVKDPERSGAGTQWPVETAWRVRVICGRPSLNSKRCPLSPALAEGRC